MIKLLLSLICAAVMLSGCASTKFRVLEINSLASKTAGEGKFDGLESIASRKGIGMRPQDAKKVNILFLHGVGSVENTDQTPLANNFIKGVAGAYGLETDEKAVSSLCGRKQGNEEASRENHIYITEITPKTYEALPGRILTLDDLVCMDKQVLKVSDDLEYVIYRIFWDEIFWESLQIAFVGQDGSIGENSYPASLRRKYNSLLKDKLINFGFSDAVMYMGPAGKDIRNAIRGAMCSAVLDAAGYPISKQGPRTNFKRICDTASNTSINTAPFAFVSESLGSKITFDIMREAMTDSVDNIHDDIFKGSQVFMLANQIPLLSLHDLREKSLFQKSDYEDGERPSLIAFSEVNDFLTYELVPFYEQLYSRTITNTPSEFNVSNAENREYIVDLLGFNIIDMRVEFASPLIPFVSGFVDPLFAHNGHVKQPEVMEYMLCGADGREARVESCTITSGPNVPGWLK